MKTALQKQKRLHSRDTQRETVAKTSTMLCAASAEQHFYSTAALKNLPCSELLSAPSI